VNREKGVYKTFVFDFLRMEKGKKRKDSKKAIIKEKTWKIRKEKNLYYSSRVLNL